MTFPIRCFLALLISLAATGVSLAATVNGVVSHVTDGDSIWIRPAGGEPAFAVRIQGIDAPEICQSFGRRSRDALAARVSNRPVQVTVRAHDIYHRSVARVSVDGHDIGEWMVGNGYAWSSRFHGRTVAYAAEEAQARSARRGLWSAGPAMEPRAFRKRHGACRPLRFGHTAQPPGHQLFV